MGRFRPRFRGSAVQGFSGSGFSGSEVQRLEVQGACPRRDSLEPLHPEPPNPAPLRTSEPLNLRTSERFATARRSDDGRHRSRSVSPVIHPARGDARKRIRSAISSGWPGRPSGCVSFDRSRNAPYWSSPMPARLCRLRDDDAGVDGVDADAFRRELERGAARQLIERRLAHAVGEHARRTIAGRSRSTR